MMMLCCWWAACYLEDNQWPVGMGGPKSSDRTCADVIGFTKSYKTLPCGTLGRARDLGDGGVLLGFQVRLLLKTNFVTATASQGWRPSCITRASTTKCFYISLTIGTSSVAASGMRNQSSVGNFFLIPLGLRPRSNRQKSTYFLYTDDWRSRSVIYERSE